MRGIMFAKYNDNLAATVIGIYLLGVLVYVIQLIFMTEIWLKGEEIDVSAVIVARVLGATWLGLAVGVILTFLYGPDGQKTFFTGLLVAQVAVFLALMHSHFILNTPQSGDDAAIVSVLTLLLLIGWYRMKDRL